MTKVAAIDRSYTLEELSQRIRFRPRSEHHRLPTSRGGNNGHTNTLRVNELMHFDWHTITRNQTGAEVAAQWTVWWSNGHIFVQHPFQEISCPTKAIGTLDDPKLRGGRQTHKPSGKQYHAWYQLFGGKTPPEIVIEFTNRFLVHPDSPLIIVCELKDEDR